MTVHQEIKQLLNTKISNRLAITPKYLLLKMDIILSEVKQNDEEFYNKIMKETENESNIRNHTTKEDH